MSKYPQLLGIAAFVVGYAMNVYLPLFMDESGSEAEGLIPLSLALAKLLMIGGFAMIIASGIKRMRNKKKKQG
ncbi:MAG: hypothetical protein Q8R76_00505 [Candidatus Omnitrophota bacterium]|nr:hypothetical protein [Candidatus Omnitrophota bacterium]